MAKTKSASATWYRSRSNKIKSEIDALTTSLYGLDNKDERVRYLNCEMYSQEVKRNFVISMHLAMEDLLRALPFDFLVKRNQQLTKRKAIRIVDDLWSADLVDWCGRLKLVEPKQYEQLVELNRVRNKCGHNWVLEVKSRRKKDTVGKRRRVRITPVTFEGKNLFAADVFTGRFCATYSKLYLKLLFFVWRIQGKL